MGGDREEMGRGALGGGGSRPASCHILGGAGEQKVLLLNQPFGENTLE